MLQNTTGPGQEEVLNDLFRALQHPVRRRLLFSLLDHNPEDPFLEPEAVARDEGASENLSVTLYHQHLPMLEDAGFIEWDNASDVIHMGSDFTRVRNPLSALREQIQTDEVAIT